MDILGTQKRGWACWPGLAERKPWHDHCYMRLPVNHTSNSYTVFVCLSIWYDVYVQDTTITNHLLIGAKKPIISDRVSRCQSDPPFITHIFHAICDKSQQKILPASMGTSRTSHGAPAESEPVALTCTVKLFEDEFHCKIVQHNILFDQRWCSSPNSLLYLAISEESESQKWSAVICMCREFSAYDKRHEWHWHPMMSCSIGHCLWCIHCLPPN